MNISLKLAGSVALIATITACGGSEADNGPVVYTNFADISVAADAVIGAYVDDTGAPLPGVTRTEEDDLLLATGDVTYNGFVSLDDDNLIGQLALTANFDDSTVGGTASNFIHATDGEYTGTLIADGAIQPGAPAGGQLTASLTGDLSNGATDYDAFIGLDGDFFGTDYSAIAGDASGLLGGSPVSGSFAAEQ